MGFFLYCLTKIINKIWYLTCKSLQNFEDRMTGNWYTCSQSEMTYQIYLKLQN